MKKSILVKLFLFAVIGAYAQEELTIKVDNFDALIGKEGSIFNNGDGSAGLKHADGQDLLFASNLWYAGYDEFGNLKGTFEEYQSGGHIPGTINSNPALASKSLVKVSSLEIANHLANFDKQGYEMPDGILNWPANGNTSIGEMEQMAPFVDLNNDGIYQPEMGEYPNIIGNECVYLIKHDGGQNSVEIGVEEHYFISFFNKIANGVLGQSIIVNVTLYNRSNFNFDTLHVGLFNDVDLGVFIDDYIATSSENNALVFYNGNRVDDGNGKMGFGENPPGLAIGTMFCDAWGAMEKNQNVSDLETCLLALEARYNDGSCMIQGLGFSPNNQHLEKARFVYNGDLESSSSWTEGNVPNQVGDRRGILIMQPKSFASGEKVSYTTGYTLSRDTTFSNIENARLAFDEIRSVEEFLIERFADHPLIEASRLCANEVEFKGMCELTTNINESEVNTAFLLYPNPSSGTVNFEAENEVVQISVTDILGKEVLVKQNIKGQIQFHLSQGQYMVQLQFVNGEVAIRKLMIH